MPAEPRVDVPTLLGLGLDDHLSEVWLAMAAAPGAGVRELADLVGISESQVREVLDELGDRALIRASRQSPGLLVPIAPRAALEQLLRREAEEIAEQQQWVQARRDRIMRGIAAKVAARIAESGSGAVGDSADFSAAGADVATTGIAASTRRPAIEPVTGNAAVRAAFERLAHDAKTCVDCLTTATRISESDLAQAATLDASLLQRGIRIRRLYPDAIHDDAPSADYARTFQSAGAQVRTSPVLPQRLLVADRRIALVPLDPAIHNRDAAIVRAPGVVAALMELFDAVWQNAAPLDVGRDPGNEADRSGNPATGLSETERTLLRLLAGGATDERAAKKLGVSLRTVRRIMADLMHRLDANSRFEAGIKAAKRGWL